MMAGSNPVSEVAVAPSRNCPAGTPFAASA